MTTWLDAFLTSFSALMESVLLFLPKLGLAAVILAVGFAAAAVLQAVSRKFFALVGIDRLGSRIGAEAWLEAAGTRKPLSWIFGRLLFWFVLIVVLVPVADVLGMAFFGELVNRALLFLPNVFAAMLVILAGAWAAKFLSGVIRGSAARLGTEYSETLGTISNVTILLIAFIIALSQLGIDSTILSSVLLIVVGAIALGIAVSFGFGAKDVIRNVIAGIYVSRSYAAGNRVLLGDREGTIDEIGTIVTTVNFGKGAVVSVPNSAFLEAR